MKKTLLKIVTLITVFVLALSLTGCYLFESNNSDLQDQPPLVDNLTNKVEFGTIDGERLYNQKTKVIKDVRGAVVAIQMENSSSSSFGSGVIVDMSLTDEDGTVLDGANDFYILTCHHVIGDMGNITVYVPDAEFDNFGESDYNTNYAFTGTISPNAGSGQAVTLIGGDLRSDIAVLKLTVADQTIANSITKVKFPPQSNYSLEVGEEVIAIGNSSGQLPGTVSLGHISYINREIVVSGVGDMTLVQLNIDMYHGNSGGGLFNMYGELIGITNSGLDGYLSEDGENVIELGGLNFAVPYVIDADNGDADYGFMNVASKLLKNKTSTNYGYVAGRTAPLGFIAVEKNASLVVTAVQEGSVAALAGLRQDDVIVAASKGDSLGLFPTNIISNAQLTQFLKDTSVGDKITFKIQRGLLTHSITVTLKQYVFCDTGN